MTASKDKRCSAAFTLNAFRPFVHVGLITDKQIKVAITLNRRMNELLLFET